MGLEAGIDITGLIIGSAIEVHRGLGPGLLESAYRRCMVVELEARGLVVRTEVAVPLTYKGVEVGCGYRLDLLVAESVIVEVKAVSSLEPIHTAQLLTHLGLSSKRVGLLINFNVPELNDGIRRIVL